MLKVHPVARKWMEKADEVLNVASTTSTTTTTTAAVTEEAHDSNVFFSIR